jgi:multidrug transporter EmrE-like cation transporter
LIVVFTITAWLLFRQTPRWNNVVSFVLIIAAVYFTFNFNE